MQVNYDAYWSSITFTEFLCKSLLHRYNSVYEEYIDCILVFVIRVPKFQKTNSDHLGKQKIRHVTSVAIFWDKCNKILRQNLPKKLNCEPCEKMNIKTVVIYISLCQITVYLENSRLWDQTWPKERITKILRNRH